MAKKYIHLFVWSCPLHTKEVYRMDTVLRTEGEKWKPCTCENIFYIQLADFDVFYRLSRDFTDEIPSKLGISVEQWNKQVEGFKGVVKPANGWENACMKGAIVQQIAEGNLQIGEEAYE